MDRSDSKSSYIRSKYRLLKDFNIEVTEDVLLKLDSLYPNEVAIENYTRKIILEKLNSC